MNDKKYSIYDFISVLEGNNYSIQHDKIFTQGQIAQIIGKAMVGFFEDSNTPY